MTALGDLDRARIRELHAREVARFQEARPRSRAMIARAREHMPNGTPMAWMAFHNDQLVYIDHGEGPGFTDVDGFGYVDFNASDLAMFCGHANPAIVAAVRAQVARSTQFLLPTEASVTVAEELARRYPVGQWQFTLSATQANTEAIRLARAATGREVIVLFQGHYHGHFEEGLVDLDGERVAAVERGLSKGVAGRLRMGAYGVTAELGEQLDVKHNVATGGTLFGNPLSAAAAQAALTEVLVPAAYAHTSALGGELADGIEAAIRAAGLPWTASRFGPRCGQWYGPRPRTGAEAYALTDEMLTRLIRVWLANRGIWEALPGAGPTVPVPATRADVTRYVGAYGELLAELR